MADATGRFNSHLKNKVFCFVDEAISPSNKKDIGRLKTLVTEDELRLEEKYKNAKQVDNFVDTMAATNDQHSLPAGPSSRRFFCLDVDNSYALDKENGRKYFDGLISAMEDDDYAGLKAFQSILMEVDLGNFDRVIPSRGESLMHSVLMDSIQGQQAPQTALLRIQQHEQVDSVTKWLFECLERGYHCKLSDLEDNKHCAMFTYKEGRMPMDDTGDMDEWIREICRKDVYDCYKRVTPKEAFSPSAFWSRMKEIIPSIEEEMNSSPIQHKVRIHLDDGRKVRRTLIYVVLPTLDDARIEFAHSTGFGVPSMMMKEDPIYNLNMADYFDEDTIQNLAKLLESKVYSIENDEEEDEDMKLIDSLVDDVVQPTPTTVILEPHEDDDKGKDKIPLENGHIEEPTTTQTVMTLKRKRSVEPISEKKDTPMDGLEGLQKIIDQECTTNIGGKRMRNHQIASDQNPISWICCICAEVKSCMDGTVVCKKFICNDCNSFALL